MAKYDKPLIFVVVGYLSGMVVKGDGGGGVCGVLAIGWGGNSEASSWSNVRVTSLLAMIAENRRFHSKLLVKRLD